MTTTRPRPGTSKTPSLFRVQESPEPAAEDDSVPCSCQEIAEDDSMTNDYMDYGKYEQNPPSQATEAVKRVKRKISRKRSTNRNTILDWIN